MGVPDHAEQVAAGSELPSLPTAETIAEGVLGNASNPAWLSKRNKYKLFLAVEEYITAGYTVDQVLAAIGLNRAIYFGSIWFTDTEQERMIAELDRESGQKGPSEHDTESSNGQATVKKHRKSRDAAAKLAAIEEISRLRYVEGYDFDEACRLVGVTRRRFYDWSTQRSELSSILRRKEQRKSAFGKSRGGNRVFDISDDDSISNEVLAETLEQRKALVDEVHRLTVHGLELRVAARKVGILTKQYHAWVREIEQERRYRESPLELWRTYKAGGDGAEEARTRFIEHFTPTARRLAVRYADRVRRIGAFDIDEDELVSVGLWDGVAKNMDVYDPERGVPISAFFHQKIALRMLDNMRIQDWVPRLDRARFRDQAALTAEFTRVVGRPPVGVEELNEYQGGAKTQESAVTYPPFHVSLDATYAEALGWSQEYADHSASLYDSLGADDVGQDREMQRVATLADELIGRVHGKQREVLFKFVFHAYTFLQSAVTPVK